MDRKLNLKYEVKTNEIELQEGVYFTYTRAFGMFNIKACTELLYSITTKHEHGADALGKATENTNLVLMDNRNIDK